MKMLSLLLIFASSVSMAESRVNSSKEEINNQRIVEVMNAQACIKTDGENEAARILKTKHCPDKMTNEKWEDQIKTTQESFAKEDYDSSLHPVVRKISDEEYHKRKGQYPVYHGPGLILPKEDSKEISAEDRAWCEREKTGEELIGCLSMSQPGMLTSLGQNYPNHMGAKTWEERLERANRYFSKDQDNKK